jgi:hypothetical protein
MAHQLRKHGMKFGLILISNVIWGIGLYFWYGSSIELGPIYFTGSMLLSLVQLRGNRGGEEHRIGSHIVTKGAQVATAR